MFRSILAIIGGIRAEDLNSCWLAATNPRFLRESRNQNTFEEITILDLCVYINKAISNLTHLQQHLSLRIVINLLFGTVRIYQQQIQVLYEKTMILMCHPEIRWVQFEKKPLKRKAANSREKNMKKVLLSSEIVLTEVFLSDMYAVLELNEEERRILNSQALPTSCNDLHLLKNDIPTNQSSEDFLSSNIDDFGALSLEDVDRLMEITPRKRRHNEVSDVDELDCTELFKRPRHSQDKQNDKHLDKSDVNHSFTIPSRRTEYSETIQFTVEENVCSPREAGHPPGESNQEAYEQTNNRAQINRTPQREPSCTNYEFFRGANGLNRCATSTPKASPQALDRSLVYIPEELMSKYLRHQRASKKSKNCSKLKFDTEIKINKRKYIQQFDTRSTLRTTIPCQDVVSLSEMKMQNSKKLFEMPCHMCHSALLMQKFRKFVLKTASNDHSILMQILNNIFAGDFNFNKNGESNQPTSSNTNPNATLVFDENNDEPLNKRPRLTEQHYESEENNNWIHVEKVVEYPKQIQIPPLQARHQEVLNILHKLWRKNHYPINMSTICTQNRNRRAAASMFLTVIELSVKGYIEIEKNLETQGIHNIQNKVNFVQLREQ